MIDDLGLAAKIAASLILLAVVLSIIFIILGFTRVTTDQGMNSFQNSMEQMSLTQFAEYDQATKSGLEVKSAIKLFEGSNTAICIQTAAGNKAEEGTYYNFGAVLKGTTEKVGNTTMQKVKFPPRKAGESWFVQEYAASPITFNMDTTPTDADGSTTFIRPTAKFLGTIIKNNTGSIVGIAFTQL